MRLLALVPVALVAAGCSSGAGSVSVTASDTECQVGAITLQPGRHRLRVTNRGLGPADVSVRHMPEDRVLARESGILPGDTVTLATRLDSGQYQVACQPAGRTNALRANLFVGGGKGLPGIRPPDGDRVVDVYATDFRFANLDQLDTVEGQVYGGEMVIFRLTNRGPSKHSFAVTGPDGTRVATIPRTAKGATRQVTFAAPVGGRYTYQCTMTGHAKRGMRGSFRVVVSEAEAS